MIEPVYTEANHTVYHGDMCAIVPQLEMVDHCLTDLPFHEYTHRGARTRSANTGTDHDGTSGVLIDFASIDDLQVRICLGLIGMQLKRWFVASMDWRHLRDLEEIPPIGFRKWLRHGSWLKTDPAPQFTGTEPGTGWESICIMHADRGGHKRWNGGGHPATYIGPTEKRGQYRTQKPEWLIGKWIVQFTDPGDLVLDPFCGGGTVAAMCKKLGRRSISIDRSRRAVDLTIARLQATYEAPIVLPEPKRRQDVLDFAA
ncbi:MAG TPA: DNA methyltransferase [Herpetosiphonaceae bacterium]